MPRSISRRAATRKSSFQPQAPTTESHAYHFGFLLDGKYTWYTPTFDPELSAYSPGEVLLRRLFLSFSSDHVREFDFTIGDEAYKKRYANRINKNYTLFLYARRFNSRLFRVARHLKRMLK